MTPAELKSTRKTLGLTQAESRRPGGNVPVLAQT